MRAQSRATRHLAVCLSMSYDSAHADRPRNTARPGVPRAGRREPPRDGRPPVARRGLRERARRPAGHVAAVPDAAPRRAAAQRPRALAEGRPRPDLPARARPDAHARAVDRRAPRDLGGALRPPLRRPRRRLPQRSRRPPMSIRQHDFTIERRFRQTPAQTFRAFADPGLKQRWFGVPEAWTDAQLELDFRVGGSEVSVGRDPRGALHEFRSRYHDIVDGERIVFAYDLLLDGRLISVSLTTVEVRPDGHGTRLVFTEHGAFFDDLEDPAERQHGTGLLLDGLAAFLAEQLAA